MHILLIIATKPKLLSDDKGSKYYGPISSIRLHCKPIPQSTPYIQLHSSNVISTQLPHNSKHNSSSICTPHLILKQLLFNYSYIWILLWIRVWDHGNHYLVRHTSDCLLEPLSSIQRKNNRHNSIRIRVQPSNLQHNHYEPSKS